MDTITLQEALAGFTANESAALGSYIGLSSGGAGQKQSIAALAKVAGEQMPVIGLKSFLTLKGAPSQLSDGTDLNTLLTPGSYHVLSNTNAQTLLNAPTGRFGNCRVIVITNTGGGSSQYGWQIYMEMYNIWIRARSGDTFREWKSLLVL